MNTLERRKVLVVEDSRLVHMMYDTILRKCQVVHAHDGLEAMAKLRDHRDVDAILLDMNMPRMNGLEVLELLKADESLKRIPVIIVTTEGNEESAQQAIGKGAAAFLTKPFRAEHIFDALSRALAETPR
jgi:two-component system, chemotaxis family, chemotaxis protein CheY